MLLGSAVVDASGQRVGKLRDIAVGTGTEAGRVAGLIYKTRSGLFWVSATEVQVPAAVKEPNGLDSARAALRLTAQARPESLRGDESFVLLRQDLLDRQIIDVHGRKVVRVNDVDLQWFTEGTVHDLRVSEVEVGLRGAARRLLLGLLPHGAIDQLTSHINANVIPWDFVDLIEADPARRVKLKLSHERLAQLHPSDIADILEDLAPAEREAIFATLDEGVAAHALEEAEPGLQKSLIESMDSERIASIVEEMDPEAAADMLAELSETHSEAILEEMGEEERHEVEELLEFRENSAAGRMTTDYVQVSREATVADAIEALRIFEGSPETVTEIYLVGENDHLQGVVPLARIVLSPPDTPLSGLSDKRYACIHENAHEREVAEIFDKYNLRALPVINEAGTLVGAVEADHVIAFLRGTR